jgi:ribonuclease BN (tRNA processing enzyme)
VCHGAGLASWQSVAVEHCADAYGLVMRHVSGWSLVFSGDSRPCRRLREAGGGCTLLIHEATFEPSMHIEVRRHAARDASFLLAAECVREAAFICAGNAIVIVVVALSRHHEKKCQ